MVNIENNVINKKPDLTRSEPTLKLNDENSVANAAMNNPELTVGSKKLLQAALIELGYSVGSTGADGVIGKNTKAGMAAFAAANGIDAQNLDDPTTQAKIFAAAFSKAKEKFYENHPEGSQKPYTRNERILLEAVTAAESGSENTRIDGRVTREERQAYTENKGTGVYTTSQIAAQENTLKVAGYSPGAIDGVRDADYTNAVKAFETNHANDKGVVADGRLNREEMDILRAEAAKNIGKKNTAQLTQSEVRFIETTVNEERKPLEARIAVDGNLDATVKARVDALIKSDKNFGWMKAAGNTVQNVDPATERTAQPTQAGEIATTHTKGKGPQP